MAYENFVEQQEYNEAVIQKCNEAIESAKNNIENLAKLQDILLALNKVAAQIKKDIHDKSHRDYWVAIVVGTYQKIQNIQEIGKKLEEFRIYFIQGTNFINLLRTYETVCSTNNNLESIPNDLWKKPYQDLRANIKKLVDFFDTHGIIGLANNPESFKNLIIKFFPGTLLPELKSLVNKIYTDLTTWNFLPVNIGQPGVRPLPDFENKATQIQNKVREIQGQISILKNWNTTLNHMYETMKQQFQILKII